MVQLTPHFSEAEALARSGYTEIPARLRPNVVRQARRMEELRRRVNAARRRRGLEPTGIRVLSWLRSPAKNRAVGGASKSRHLEGDACDLALEEIDRLCPWPGGRQTFDRIAEHVFADGGLGLYPRGNRHVDTRGHRARWTTH